MNLSVNQSNSENFDWHDSIEKLKCDLIDTAPIYNQPFKHPWIDRHDLIEKWIRDLIDSETVDTDSIENENLKHLWINQIPKISIDMIRLKN